VAQLVLVLPAPEVADPPAWLGALVGTAAGVLTVTAGGRERSDSVVQGLAALDARCAVVLVHDAARPFVSQVVIDAVIAAADAGEAAVAAVAVGDTLKAADPADPTRAVRTVPREGLWRAQTPQGFPAALLREAYRRQSLAPAPATDDATLVERLGATVRLVPDSSRNFKITTADDLALAEVIAVAEIVS
jgi:2-C-methyl-D-erythritol 4-phosphate cytidylyltransferase